MKSRFISFFAGCCLIGFLSAPTRKNAQPQPAAHFSWDTSALLELYNSVAVTFTLDEPGHKNWNLLNNRHNRKQFRIRVYPGAIDDGMLTFNRAAAAKNGHRVNITLIPQQRPGDSQQFTLPIPYVETIRFNFFTDSLKRAIPFYLNVEGVYSSGRIFPLDTSLIRFANSGGVLKGNNILIPVEDTVTREVKISAVFKADTSLHIQTVIPVKKVWNPFQPMPGEETIFNN